MEIHQESLLQNWKNYIHNNYNRYYPWIETCFDELNELKKEGKLLLVDIALQQKEVTLKLSIYFIFSNSKEKCKVPAFLYIPFSQSRLFWIESRNDNFDKILPQNLSRSISKSSDSTKVFNNCVELGIEFEKKLVFEEPIQIEKKRLSTFIRFIYTPFYEQFVISRYDENEIKKITEMVDNKNSDFRGSDDSKCFAINYTDSNGNTFKIFVKKTVLNDNSSKKLKREKKIQLAVRHQNCLKMYYSYKKDGYQYSIMEYGDRDLANYLDNVKQEYDEKTIKIILLGISRGLDYLHSNFIIHRDIKSKNIVLKKYGDYYFPLIIDYGSSRYIHEKKEYSETSENSKSLNETLAQSKADGVTTNTIEAPEMCTCHYDCRVDIFALGCVMVDILKFIITRTSMKKCTKEKEKEIYNSYLIILSKQLEKNEENMITHLCSLMKEKFNVDIDKKRFEDISKCIFNDIKEMQKKYLLSVHYIYNHVEMEVHKRLPKILYSDIKEKICYELTKDIFTDIWNEFYELLKEIFSTEEKLMEMIKICKTFDDEKRPVDIIDMIEKW